MKPWVFFDLDGTLINVNERYANVLRSYLGVSKEELSTEDFVQWRRLGIKDDEIAKKVLKQKSGFDLQRYKSYRKSAIEDITNLKKDTIIVNTDLMGLLSEEFQLGLITIRREKEKCLAELESFGLLDFFSGLHILRPLTGKNPKVEVLRAINNKWALFGDSHIDKEAAEKSGIDFYYVKTGYEALKVSYAFTDVNEAIAFYLKGVKQNGIY